MTAVSVTWNGTRIDASDGASSAGNIGGGAGSGGEPDIVYQGSGGTPEDRSRKVGTGAAGFYLTTTITDISTATGAYQTAVMKYNAANSAALELLATVGIEIRLGSGTSAYAEYDTYGADNYPEKGGFVFTCVDPNITGYRTATVGSPALASADYFGILGDFTATSKSENLVLSAVDVGDGYTITGGGGADPTATFQDVVDYNSILANRHGYMFALEGQEGAYGCYGTLEWGSSALPVDHADDSASTVFFLDGFYAAGWAGILDNTLNASTVINPSGNTYISRGNTTTTDTRAVYNVSGTNGAPTRTGEKFVNFAQFNSASHFTYVDCDIQTADLTQNSAEFSDCTLRPTTASGVAMCNDATFTKFTNGLSVVQGGAGHAFESTTAGSVTLSGVKTSGFGGTAGSNLVANSGSNDAFFYNNSGGLITLSIEGGGDSPSVRNGVGSTTIVANSKSFEFAVNPAVTNYEWRIYSVTAPGSLSGSTELDGEESATLSSQTYSYTYTADVFIAVQIIESGVFVETVEYYTLKNANQSVTINLQKETNQ